jgi:hypothetical protein
MRDAPQSTIENRDIMHTKYPNLIPQIFWGGSRGDIRLS